MGLRAVDPVPLQTRHDQPRFLSIWNPDASCDIIVMTSLPRPCHKNVPGGASLARVPHRPRGASPGVAKRRCLRSMLNHDWLSHLWSPLRRHLLYVVWVHRPAFLRRAISAGLPPSASGFCNWL